MGWARRGPSGTIGTNRPDGYRIVELIAEDIAAHPANKAGGKRLAEILAERRVKPVDTAAWQRIEAAETARARDGAPREKFTNVSAMIDAGR